VADAAPALEVPPFSVVATGYQFVEGPRVAADGTLWFSDLLAGGYHRIAPDGTASAFATGRQWIGGAVLVEDGTLVVSGRGGLARLDPATGRLTPLPLATGDPFELCANDLEAAPDGGIIGGTIDFASIMETHQPPRPGTLFHRAPDGRLTILRQDVFASNGLGFSPCGRWLYHSETSRGVWRYPLGADGLPDCRPGQAHLLAAMEDSDGLVVDAEGAIWVAGWASASLRRLLPDGREDRCLSLPAFPHLVSLAFGGPDLNALYVSTGGNEAAPGLGGVVKIRVEVPGLRDRRAQVPA